MMKKDNNQPRHVVNTTWRVSKRYALLAALFLPGLALAQTVNISPVVSSGNGIGYTEHQANLWFLLDDSGSMGAAAPPCASNEKCLWGTSFIAYDTNITYALPNRIDGSPMPLPSFANRIYFHPFIDDANNLALSSWSTTTILKADTDPLTWAWPATYYTVPACSALEPDASRLTNCIIWRNYYNSKMLVLKSALSLNLFGAANASKTEAVRLGFTSLHNNSASGLSPHILPVLPFYGSDADSNKTQFQRWLYSLYPSNGTPLRDLYSDTASDLLTQSKASNPWYETDGIENPFADIPGQAVGADNPLRMCRRNYMVLFTDGDWNTTPEATVVDNLTRPSYIKTNGVNDSDTFPDGVGYSSMAPFAYNDVWNENGTPLTDIAFALWKTDMDNDTSTDGLRAKNTELGAPPAPASHNGSPYWHPYNDPASWQHINTYTIGFGLNNPRNLYVNPPTPAHPTGIDLAYVWQLKYWDEGINDSIEDLAGAAVAGRGRFYDTKTPEDLNNAFDDILKGVIPPIPEITVNAAAGMGGGSQRLDNSYYVGRYDGENFTGELIKYNLYNGDPGMTCDGSPTVWGELCNTAWNAGETLTAASPASRNIITLKRQKSGTDLTAMNDPSLTVNNINYEVVDFTTGNISPAQQTRLQSAFPPQLTAIAPAADRLPALFDYIRGNDTNEEGVSGGTETFRNRNEHNYLNDIADTTDDIVARNILGAVMRASPVFVGIPNGYVKHFEGAGPTYTNYTNYVSSFISANTSGNKEVVYVGANDGMLHAFKANTGEELFAYVPSAVYDKLPKTVVPAPANQLSLVDGNVDVQSVYFATDWYRALVGSMGGGAKGLYALNITNPTAIAVKNSSVINWEYGELESILYQKDQGVTSPVSNMGHILAKPAIIQLQDNTWVAIVGNGYNSASNKAAVIVINLKTGKPIQELVLDTANSYSDASKPNGLGPLYFVSYSGKPRNKSNQYDRAYAGDLQGNLWVFDLEGSDASSGIKVISQGSDTSGTPLFTAKDSANNPQPITVYPLVVKHPLNYGHLVHFGTGALFAPDDLSSTINNSIYAIWDDWVPSNKDGLPTPRTSTVDSSELNEVKLTQRTVTVSGSGGTPIDVVVRELDSSNTATDWKLSSGTHRGWRIDLDNGSAASDSERAWQPAYTAYGAENVQAIAYNTIRYDEQGLATACETPGNEATSSRLAFNGNDAALRLPRSGVLDINQDNSVTEADREILVGGTYVPIPPVTTVEEIGISQNPSSQTLNDPPPCVGPSCPPPPPTSRTACRTVTTLTALSGGAVTPSTVERCSYFSSWAELK